MANKTTTSLTAATALDGTELVAGVQGGNSRKITSLQLVTPTLSAANQALARGAFGAPLKGHLFGLEVSNNATDATNDTDWAAGECASEQSSPLLMVFAGATGVQLDVAYGTGSGGRFDSSISDGWWHCFIISNGTTVGRGLSKSLNPTGQANWPSGYTHYRRIGSVYRASSAIVAFIQNGDFIEFKAPTSDVSAISTTPTLRTIKTPAGLKLMARIGFQFAYTDVLPTVNHWNPALGATLPSTRTGISQQFVNSSVSQALGHVIDVMTDTSARIYNVASGSASSYDMQTLGYFDTRGRLG